MMKAIPLGGNAWISLLLSGLVASWVAGPRRIIRRLVEYAAGALGAGQSRVVWT
jgi:hypothetical protein